MSLLAPGVAHISYRGGGMFLPVRTPYDRQVLVEHITDRVRNKSRVQVLIDKHRWLIDRFGAASVHCSSCGQSLDAACYDPLEDSTAFCIDCIFGTESGHADQPLPQRRSA